MLVVFLIAQSMLSGTQGIAQRKGGYFGTHGRPNRMVKESFDYDKRRTNYFFMYTNSQSLNENICPTYLKHFNVSYLPRLQIGNEKWSMWGS